MSPTPQGRATPSGSARCATCGHDGWEHGDVRLACGGHTAINGELCECTAFVAVSQPTEREKVREAAGGALSTLCYWAEEWVKYGTPDVDTDEVTRLADIVSAALSLAAVPSSPAPPHEPDHGRIGNPVNWCERCRLDAPAEPAGERTPMFKNGERPDDADTAGLLRELAAFVDGHGDHSLRNRALLYSRALAALPSAPREREVTDVVNEVMQGYRDAYPTDVWPETPFSDAQAASVLRNMIPRIHDALTAALSPSPDGVQK